MRMGYGGRMSVEKEEGQVDGEKRDKLRMGRWHSVAFTKHL